MPSKTKIGPNEKTDKWMTSEKRDKENSHSL